MIFDPHPPRVLRPDKAPPLLMTLEQKLEAFERAGLHAVAIVRFTPELSRWEPELFVETVLIDWLRASEVWVGDNFLFGRDRSGTFTLLRALGEDRGFRVEKIDPVRYKDFVVSSTRIRHLVAEGRVDEAGALLGHHYFVDGVVVHGDGRGRELGFPDGQPRTGQRAAAGLRHLRDDRLMVDGLPSGGDERRRPADDRRRRASPIETYPARRRVTISTASGFASAFVKWLRAEVKFDGLEPAARADGARMRREATARLRQPWSHLLIESLRRHAPIRSRCRCRSTRRSAPSAPEVAGALRRSAAAARSRRGSRGHAA